MSKSNFYLFNILYKFKIFIIYSIIGFNSFYNTIFVATHGFKFSIFYVIHYLTPLTNINLIFGNIS